LSISGDAPLLAVPLIGLLIKEFPVFVKNNSGLDEMIYFVSNFANAE
jgi:hypothetical protein